MAAVHESKQHTAAEIAQLLYWTALLAVSAGLELDDVLKELQGKAILEMLKVAIPNKGQLAEPAA